MRSTADAKIKIESKSTAAEKQVRPNFFPSLLFLCLSPFVSLDELATGLVITHLWILLFGFHKWMKYTNTTIT